MSCRTPLLPDPRAFEDALAAVPGWGGALHRDRIVPLGCGGPSASFRVTTSTGDWVLRVVHDPALARLLGVDPSRERGLQQCAAEAGIAPPLAAVDPAGRWQVRRWLAGRAWTAQDFDAVHARARVAALLHRLQALAPPSPARRTLDPLALVRDWSPRLGSTTGRNATAEIREALSRIDSGRRRAVIIHSDLHAGNIVDDGRRLWLIDWEYAHVGDPLCDLAAMIAGMPQLGAHGDELIRALGLSGAVAPGELEAWTSIYRRITSLWQTLAWES